MTQSDTVKSVRLSRARLYAGIIINLTAASMMVFGSGGTHVIPAITMGMVGIGSISSARRGPLRT